MDKEFIKGVLKKTMVNIFTIHHSFKNKIERVLIAISLVVAMFIYFKYRPNTVQMLIVSSNYFWLKAMGQQINENKGKNIKPANELSKSNIKPMMNMNIVPKLEEVKEKECKAKLKDKYHLDDYVFQLQPPKQYKLPFLLGMNENGKPTFFDLDELQTIIMTAVPKGGKSVTLNTFEQSFMRYNPHAFMINVDFKDVELVFYEDFDNILYCGYDFVRFAEILTKVKEEMTRRYQVIRKKYTHIDQYNQEMGEVIYPPIIITVDEFSALRMSCMNKELIDYIETIMIDLENRGRAALIHLVIAAQRIDGDQINSKIKALCQCGIYGRYTDRNTMNNVMGVKGLESLQPGEFMVRCVDGELKKIKVFYTDFDSKIFKALKSTKLEKGGISLDKENPKIY